MALCITRHLNIFKIYCIIPFQNQQSIPHIFVYTYLLAIWHNEQQGVNHIKRFLRSFLYTRNQYRESSCTCYGYRRVIKWYTDKRKNILLQIKLISVLLKNPTPTFPRLFCVHAQNTPNVHLCMKISSWFSNINSTVIIKNYDYLTLILVHF